MNQATWPNLLIPWMVLLSTGSQPADSPLERLEYEQVHMGTKFRIVVYAPDERTALRASQAAFGRVAELDAMLSDYRADSELMVLCRQSGGPPRGVSPELFRVLARAQEMARQSGGAFDVTVGPAVRLWRRARRMRRAPDAAQIRQAMTVMGYENVRLDGESRSVQLLKEGMQLDLGGIAKGYAADEAMEQLRLHGIRRALVAAAGDIVVADPPPGMTGWRIGIGSLDAQEDRSARVLLLRQAAVSTSGDAEQFVELDGKRYSHIVDPRTGQAIVGRMSVTVCARDGITADALATAAAVLGPRAGLELVGRIEGAEALLMRQTEQGVEEVASERFQDLLTDPAKP